MKKIKSKILDWLLKDDEIKKEALFKVIGDAEVKQVEITNSENVTISDCYLINASISNNRNLTITNNEMQKVSFTGNYGE